QTTFYIKNNPGKSENITGNFLVKATGLTVQAESYFTKAGLELEKLSPAIREVALSNDLNSNKLLIIVKEGNSFKTLDTNFIIPEKLAISKLDSEFPELANAIKEAVIQLDVKAEAPVLAKAIEKA